MKKLACLFAAAALALVLPLAASAEFVLQGPLQLTTSKGLTVDKTFGFAFEQSADGYLFRVGAQQLSVAEVPKRYTLSLILHQNAEVWATDFHPEPIQGFRWSIGPHRFHLFKQAQKPARPGDFVLDIDGLRHYFVPGKPIQIHFLFEPHGISELRVEGTLKPKR